MIIGYSDFVELCRVDDTENLASWLSVRGDGVYVKTPPNGLNHQERAILSEHPTGNLDEPALRFPCNLPELQAFLEQQGVYGCIDAFDMADWFVKGKGASARVATTSRAHVSDKLAKMNQAAAKFWGFADRDDRRTRPENATVTAWLVQQGFSQTLADKAATIIRPEWAPTGRRPEE
ncbi:MAG: hypothetical protein Q8O37_17475 [Sulfuricellaceae bacterium]|nr:hypothetical protein [Sulfuricellaceae bacterium]